MTNEDAIVNLKMIRVAFVEAVTKEQAKLIDDTFDMAIKALEQEPCGKDINVPTTDAISRQAVLNILDDMVKDYMNENDFDKAQGIAWVKVQKLPPVNPQPKTGHWIEKDGFDGDVYYDCSECGESWTTIEGTPWDNVWNYCPSCGAKMEV